MEIGKKILEILINNNGRVKSIEIEKKLSICKSTVKKYIEILRIQGHIISGQTGDKSVSGYKLERQKEEITNSEISKIKKNDLKLGEKIERILNKNEVD